MRFLFLYTDLGTLGGIETLMARMAGWLGARGHEVSLLVERGGPAARLFPNSTRVVEAGGSFHTRFARGRAGSCLRELGIPAPGVIKAFDARSAWLAVRLGSALDPAPRILAGVYGGAGFFPTRRRPFREAYWRLLSRTFVEGVPGTGRLFVSEEQLRLFRSVYGPGQEGILWHLPVDGTAYRSVRHDPVPGHIVSVSRLAPMKEYTLQLVPIVGRLRERGLPATLSIHGDGPFLGRIARQVAECGWGDAVRLCGSLEHARVPEVLAGAAVFVGMGTAVIEAAFAGVPNVVAVAHDGTGRSFGPLHRLPPGALGEPGLVRPESTLERELERILRLSPGDYAREREQVRAHARHFDMDTQMERFLELCSGAPLAGRTRWMDWAFELYWRGIGSRRGRRRAADLGHAVGV